MSSSNLLAINIDVCDNKDPRDVSKDGFNRFDPKYVSIGPKKGANNLTAAINSNKCATLRHGGRFGGSLSVARGGTSPSPNLKNVSQPVIQPHQLEQQNNYRQEQQELEFQEERDWKVNFEVIFDFLFEY